MELEIYSKCRLHFGELIQISISDKKRVCISNVLDVNYVHPFIRLLQSSSESVLCVANETNGAGDTDQKLFSFKDNWHKKNNDTKSMHVINTILKSTCYFGKTSFYTNNHDLEGLGMGSSTADIINAIKSTYALLREECSVATINYFLRKGEKASDPLHLEPVVYDTVRREEDRLFMRPRIPSYLILSVKSPGLTPIVTDSMTYTFFSEEECRELFSLICNEQKPPLEEHIDNIKRASAESLDIAQKFLKNPNCELIKEVANKFNLGITGSHSGNMIGLTLWMQQIEDYNLHANIVEYINFLSPNAEVAIGKCTQLLGDST